MKAYKMDVGTSEGVEDQEFIAYCLGAATLKVQALGYSQEEAKKWIIRLIESA